MFAPASPFSSASSDEYRRRARKLRARHANDLVALHQALSELAQQTDQLAASQPKVEGPAGGFAQLVAQELEGPVLRYSKRQELLREAERRGIGRFEANLIIAAVQHQSDRPARANSSCSNYDSWRAGVAACAVQGLIFLAMYLLLFN
jgi:hypothetical protein